MPLSPLELPVTPASPSPENRRRAARKYERFHVHASGEPQEWEGINLSEGGMLCVAPTPVWPGTPLAVTLSTQDAPAVQLHAHVAELVPHGRNVAMRMKFVALTDAHRSALASLLDGLKQ